MPHPRLLTLLACATALAACASGPSGPPNGRGRTVSGQTTLLIAPEALLFVDFDLNRDLAVSLDEVTVGADAAWTDISRGGDTVGYLEVQDWITARVGTNAMPITVMSFDPNYDAGITAAEFKTELRRRFLERDRNMDKRLSREEFVENLERQVRQPMMESLDGGPGGGGRGGRPPR